MKIFDTAVDLEALKLSDNDRKAVVKLGFNGLFLEQLVIAIRGKWGVQAMNPSAGLPMSKGRIWHRIEKKLEARETTVEFEEAEWDFIKELLLSESTPWDPVQYRLIMQYVDKIETIELRSTKGE